VSKKGYRPYKIFFDDRYSLVLVDSRSEKDMSAADSNPDMLLYSEMSNMDNEDLPAMAYTQGENGSINPSIIIRRDPNTNEILCHNCNSGEKPTKKCSRCSFAYYCGPDCQREHWDQHKAICDAVSYHGVTQSKVDKEAIYREYRQKNGNKSNRPTLEQDRFIQESLMTHVGAISKFNISVHHKYVHHMCEYHMCARCV